jgi:putative peptide modification system cyclase
VVRTVLICDLVESTALVERLGDERAFRLAHHHDRLARDLMERHGGREIDKTDGFLLLFERPIQAVRFALDYHRALTELAAEAGEPVRARVGIHLGEVFLSENVPEDVARGAKPLEVEGLAKPMAARLMSLAEGGQTLLTRGAFELAARAAKGTLSDEVRWLPHGRYWFRGVEEPVAVFEVGHPGRAPLRPPRGSEKARPEGVEGAGSLAWARRRWRSLTAAGSALVAAAAVGMVVLLDQVSPDAFAFEAQDWVVVGDFQNLTADPVLSDSLDLAFRIGLEQSRFANVVPDSLVRKALLRMKRDPDAPVERQVGLEVCQREGARALLVGSIAEVGGEYVLTGEILQPPSGRTVVSETARARHRDDILDGLEAVTRRLRERLGEPLPEIEEATGPLEKVTTADLEALRAYSLALQRINQSREPEAIALLERAVELDPEFAMAWARLGTLHSYHVRDPRQAAELWDRALALEERLTEFEHLYLQASKSWEGSLDDMTRAWSLLATLFPDQTVGHHNLGVIHDFQYLHQQAADAYRKATETKGPLVNTSYENLGLALLALGEREAALEALETAVSSFETPNTGLIDAYLLFDRYQDAEAVIRRKEASRDPAERFVGHQQRAVWLLDRGRPQASLRSLDRAAAIARDQGDAAKTAAVLSGKAAIGGPGSGSTPDLLVRAVEALTGQPGGIWPRQLMSVPIPELAILGKAAARRGETSLARRVLREIEPAVSAADVPHWRAYREILLAEIALADGRMDDSLAALERAGREADLFELHESLARAREQAGDLRGAISEHHWLSSHRGLALAEWLPEYFGKEARVLAWALAPYHLGRLHQGLDEPRRAAEEYRRFIARWAEGEPDAPFRERAAEALAALTDP